MPFQVSPGVNVSEIDLTTIVPAVASTFGATAGVFKWGPIEERVLVSSEDELVSVFGKPTANNYESFFTAANFLAYGNQLYVTRAASSTTYNSYANSGTSSPGNIVVKNLTDYQTQKSTLETSSTYGNVYFVSKYAGADGNSLKISICPSSNAYQANILAYVGSNTGVRTSNTEFRFSLSVAATSANVWFQHLANTYSTVAADDIKTKFSIGDKLLVGNSTIGTQYMTIQSVGSVTTVPTTNATHTWGYSYFPISFEETFRQKDDFTITGKLDTGTGANTVLNTKYWEFHNAVDTAPTNTKYVTDRNANNSIRDEIHIIVSDEDGKITGIPGEILEVWSNLSVAKDAKSEQGGSNYYRDVLNNQSRYVWSTRAFETTEKNSDDTSLASGLTNNISLSFGGGSDGDTETTIATSKLMTAYDLYKSSEDVDVSLILGGKSRGNNGEVLANYIIDNICEYRKDCVAFISPDLTDTVNVPGQEMNNLIEFRNSLTSTSYAVLDSGYKYQYDKYNDTYRWVPLNGDIAGLCVRTDNIRDPWWSPAGVNRGIIKNVVKLSYNPNKANRDVIYRNGINPVVTLQGQGTLLYGDKTLLSRPSAFDRINVRRLFIVLEKAIATAAKSTLFEFNDDFTRAAFRNLVEPYLRDIQGRRGIYDFRVVCDTTNNTPEVIDRNEFRGDIYIKPARSINFIQLNFVAVRTGVEFEEIVGKF
jgi:phage tail sheath protein FI